MKYNNLNLKNKNKVLKYSSLFLLVMGLILIVVLKLYFECSNFLALGIFSIFLLFGLLGYWYFDKKEKGKGSISDVQIKEALKIIGSKLECGSSLVEATESLDSQVLDVINNYLEDGTGFINNSKYKDCFDLVKENKNEKNLTIIGSIIQEKTKDNEVKSRKELGYLGLAFLFIEMILVFVAIFIFKQ